MPSRDAVFMSSIIFGVAATHRRHGSRARAGWKPSVRRCFLCFLTTFGVMLLMEMLLLPSGMLRGLPGSSAAPVSVNAIRRATQDALSALTSGGPNPRPAGLAALAALPNISVVMPCFGHVAFQEEAIASVVHQQYPPAEIIVVDDGSEDHCGRAASKLLDGSLSTFSATIATQTALQRQNDHQQFRDPTALIMLLESTLSKCRTSKATSSSG